jgi:hypothetical protein
VTLKKFQNGKFQSLEVSNVQSLEVSIFQSLYFQNLNFHQNKTISCLTKPRVTRLVSAGSLVSAVGNAGDVTVSAAGAAGGVTVSAVDADGGVTVSAVHAAAIKKCETKCGSQTPPNLLISL